MTKNYAVIENGIVSNIAVWDGKTEWAPVGVEIAPVVDGVQIGWLYKGGAFTPPPQPVKTRDELIADAEQGKQSRLAHANAVTADWRTDLLLGTISDDDKAKLVLWMQYIKDVKAVNTSLAPDINWPVQPAE